MVFKRENSIKDLPSSKCFLINGTKSLFVVFTIKFINLLESCKKNLQFKILESLFAEIKRNLTGSYENYHFELKYDSMVIKPKIIKIIFIFS